MKGESRVAATESPADPTRVIESAEGSWEVRETGAGRSGTGGDAGAPLLLLTFTRGEGSGRAVREAFAVATSLGSIPEDDLLELLQRARPRRHPGGST